MKTKRLKKRRLIILFLAVFAILIAACGDGANSDTSTSDSPPPNAVITENQLPGTTDWRLNLPATNRQIEGYASATSVNHGASIDFYVNTAASTFTIDVFRMGWYGGLGGRRIFGPISATGTRQSIPMPDSATGMVDCAWTGSYTLVTRTDWVSGIYLAKLTESATDTQSYIIFVVRNDEASPKFLFQLPVTTYQTYNFWGGKSAYDWGSGNQLPWGSSSGTAAVKVSFNRPYAVSTNAAAASGMGAGEFLTNVQPVAQGYPISSAGWDYNLVRWLEKEGYDVTYATNIDLHSSSAALNRARTFLSSGHDEYWSWEMRSNVETFRNNGGNLIFFGANPVYWQIRLEKSPATGKDNRVIAIWRIAQQDPLFNDGISSNDYLVTTRWRNPPVSRPEDALVGVGFKLSPVAGDIVITNASHWVFQNSGLTNGSILPGLLGYEVDGTLSNQDGGRSWISSLRRRMVGHAAASTEILAASVATSLTDGRTTQSNMTIYTWPSGAQVFATGSMQWSWGLDDYNVPQLRSSRLNTAVIQITRNILNRFRRDHTQRSLLQFWTNGG